MKNNNMPGILTPSGRNNTFTHPDTFDQYINLMQEVILQTRKDLQGANWGQIVLANSPFSWKPDTASSTPNGVLLIHGLFDSPYYLRDIGTYFYNRNFLVNGLLLPGHGTVPGDLLDITFQEWIKAVRFGIASLAGEVKNIYLAGYSLGGILALNAALETEVDIKGLILFAPAMKPRSLINMKLAQCHKLFSWICHRAKWFKIEENNSFFKYSCYPFNAGYQATKVILRTQKKIKNRTLDQPIFIAISEDDETVCDKAILSFFNHQPNPKNKLIIYGNTRQTFSDNRIIQRVSHFPESKILNFSHTCLAISPQNPLLGANHQLCKIGNGNSMCKESYLGAITRANSRKGIVTRLSYNPDYQNMVDALDTFLTEVNSN